LAFELRETPFKMNAVCPAQRIVKYALIGQDGPTGQFFSEEYFPAPANCSW
jgi:hypothetical protein